VTKPAPPSLAAAEPERHPGATDTTSNTPTGSRRAWLLLALALAVLMGGLLLSPRVPYDRQREFCVTNVPIAGPFGAPMNLRQSRPGLILIAAAIAWPLSPFANLAQTLGIRPSRPDVDQSRIDEALAKDSFTYAAYIILNVVILLLSFYVFRLICGPPAPDFPSTVIFASVCFLLAANDVVKAFVWSPHTQMFNIFVPVFALWASIRASEGALLNSRFALVTGAITGIGATAYFLFVIVVPCVFAAGLAALIRNGSFGRLKTFSLNVLLLAVLTLLPISGWYAFVRWYTGSFFQREIEADGQVVWMLEAWQHGFDRLLETWLVKFNGLLLSADGQALPLKALLIVIVVAALMGWTRVPAVLNRLYPIVLCAILVSFATTAFYATTGVVVWRLAYASLAPLIAAAAVAIVWTTASLPDRQRKVMAFSCVAIALAQSIFVVVKSGPYS
jgi:hypothetical protein